MAELEIHDLTTMQQVIARIELTRDLSIRVRPMPYGAAPSDTGVTVKTGRNCHVFYAGRSAQSHDQAIGHELGHLVFGHPGDTEPEPEYIAAAVSRDPETERVVYYRHKAGPEEYEAEAFADCILEILTRERLRRGREPLKFGRFFG